jgi:hypothetical protein
VVVFLFRFSSSCCRCLWIVLFWFPLTVFSNIYLTSISIPLQIKTQKLLWIIIEVEDKFTYSAKGPSWPRSYGSWIYNYLCNQCLSPLMLWVWISMQERCTTLCDKICQWLARGWCFSPCPPISSINKTDRHDITEILLKVALNTIKQTNLLSNIYKYIKRWY